MMGLGRRLGAFATAALLVATCNGSAVPPPSASPPTAAATATAAQPTSPPGSASAAPSASPSTASVEWARCRASFECASVDVPLDYDDPGGETIEIALLRRPAGDRVGRIGSLLYNPGGPGGSGIDAIAQGGEFIFGAEVLRRFDIVGFDPRGVGESEAVRCLDRRPELEAAFPDDAAEIHAWNEAAEQVAAGCARNSSELLPHVETANVARDLDRIREALGDEGLTYLGHSYGTLIGALYADQFPDRVRALVLDGALDPSLDGRALVEGQARAVDAALHRFFAMCDADPACEFGDGDAATAFDDVMASFEDEPVGGVSGTNAWNGVLLVLMSGGVDGLADLLAGAEAGDPSRLGAIGAFAADPALLDAYDAITCADLMIERGPDTWEEMARVLEAAAPRSGRFLAYAPGWGTITCAHWPVPAQREPAPIAAPGAPPILVVGGTGDPATPYGWSQALADQLESAFLLTRDGDGHGSYGRNACIGREVDRYLVSLEVPVPGTVCRP